jgi:hypothetical protein
MLSQHLSTRFKTTAAKKVWFLPWWNLDLRLGRETFFVGVKKSKYSPDVWILMVAPGRPLGLLALMVRQRAVDELLQVCREIHLFLTGTPGIVEARWYFRGSRTSVAAPDELLRVEP